MGLPYHYTFQGNAQSPTLYPAGSVPKTFTKAFTEIHSDGTLASTGINGTTHCQVIEKALD